MTRKLDSDLDYVLIDEAQLQRRIAELAREIENDYRDVDNFLLLGVLKGCYIFMSDLSRAIQTAHEVEFMAVSSYGRATQSSGAVQILLDLQEDISQKNVLIVEDIVDSGLTLSYMRDSILARRPRTLKICSLLSKPSRHQIDVPIDYLGFEVPDEFVVGYGLDYAQLYRNLPYIAVLKPEAFAGH